MRKVLGIFNIFAGAIVILVYIAFLNQGFTRINVQNFKELNADTLQLLAGVVSLSIGIIVLVVKRWRTWILDTLAIVGVILVGFPFLGLVAFAIYAFL